MKVRCSVTGGWCSVPWDCKRSLVGEREMVIAVERSRVLTAIGVDTRTDLPRIVRLSRLDGVLCLLPPGWSGQKGEVVANDS